MRYQFGCDLDYEVQAETLFIFNVEVARLARHRDLVEELTITPGPQRRSYTAPQVKNRYTSVLVPEGRLSLRYSGEVDLHVHRADPAGIGEIPVSEVPLDVIPFLLPSRFVPSDRLGDFAQRQFGHLSPGHERVTRICNWIYDNIDYRRGSSNAETTATESLIDRAGVCRDFAHLGISFCRALNIPARFVSAYALGLEPADFHAVFEAYLDGRWWLFDATRQAALDGLVRIGVGRDAAEIAFCAPFGQMKPTGMTIRISRADGEPPPAERTTDAISTEEPAPDAGAA